MKGTQVTPRKLEQWLRHSPRHSLRFPIVMWRTSLLIGGRNYSRRARRARRAHSCREWCLLHFKFHFPLTIRTLPFLWLIDNLGAGANAYNNFLFLGYLSLTSAQEIRKIDRRPIAGIRCLLDQQPWLLHVENGCA
jgi:hypothetical protein